MCATDGDATASGRLIGIISRNQIRFGDVKRNDEIPFAAVHPFDVIFWMRLARENFHQPSTGVSAGIKQARFFVMREHRGGGNIRRAIFQSLIDRRLQTQSAQPACTPS